MIKSAVRAAIQALINDPNSKQWSNTALDTLTSMTFDAFWTRMLNIAPFLTSYTQTLSSMTSPGTTDLTALSKRIFKVQQVIRDGQSYQPRTPQKVTLQSNEVVAASDQQDWTFTTLGDILHVFPYATTACDVQYSFIPPLYTGLADGDTVVWPDGHIDCLILQTAVRAGSQLPEARMQWLVNEASEAWAACRAGIQRKHTGPIAQSNVDEAQQWGGEE